LLSLRDLEHLVPLTFKLRVTGSNPVGVATHISDSCFSMT
jgi:hypothetical protein